jgi:hypothetical protein
LISVADTSLTVIVAVEVVGPLSVLGVVFWKLPVNVALYAPANPLLEEDEVEETHPAPDRTARTVAVDRKELFKRFI